MSQAAQVGETVNCEIMQDSQGFFARCTRRNCTYVSRYAASKGWAMRRANAHDADQPGDGREN